MGQVLGIRFGVSGSESFNEEQGRVDSSHTATYLVQMDSESARENSVALTPGLPRIGSPSSVLSGATCKSRKFKETGPRTWDVDCDFSNAVKGNGEEADDSKPWDRTPKWSWGVETVEEPLTFDAQDPTKSLWNSAREPLPPVGRPVSVPVLTITRPELTFDGQVILDYTNMVNSGSFWGASAGQALMAGIGASQSTFEGQKFWDVSYSIKFKMDEYGWTLRLLDQGTYHWSGAVGTSQKVPFGDDALQQVVGNLDGSGAKSTSSTPSFVEFERYDEASFGALKLGPWN